MNQFRTLVTAAAAIGLSLMAAGVMAVPADGAVATGTDVSGRVSLGFTSVPAQQEIDPALNAAAVRVGKGDFLERPGCFGQVWPDITAECLSTAAEAVPLPVRTVTLGYQIGAAETVLVRTPAPQVASR